MGSLLSISAWIDTLNEKFGRICDWSVLLACLISAGNATSRYMFNLGSNSMLEIQWHLFGVIVLIGASYTLKMNEHVRVDLIYGSLSDRGRAWVDVFGLIFLLFPITFLMTFFCWQFFVTSFSQWERSQNAGGLLVWPIKFALPLGFALLTLQGASELIKRVALLQGRIASETKYEKPLQ
ncbi:TRAP transporter small permease subunit [Tardiphaga sp. OK245]|uniref:TRAP transporter small permease subunit n=1 Tax=Tardiphaga sp. OK245 TaxID=1855306 RepID=UPI0008A7D18F|nr:TRAP transporter small permease subunit [Tardiphaga sp. OK245]SEH88192.1 TRAP-type mannitol/chloroaromatic compound transport system, small permease component [Tardiphaga sp. OK245]